MNADKFPEGIAPRPGDDDYDDMWDYLGDSDEEWPECPNCQDEGCTLCTPDCQED